MRLFAAIDSRVITALMVLGGLAIFAVLLVATAAGDLRGRRKARVPIAFRPGPSDEELESKVLVRYLAWGSLSLIFIALWIPAYWLREPTRLANKALSISKNGIEEGRKEYENLCVSCHGKEAEGGLRTYPIGGIDRTYAEPPLKYMRARYKAAGRNDEEITQLIYDAINRGRAPGTPMPTWGLAFGGPLNSRQVETIVDWIDSIQEPFPEETSTDGAAIFAANCAVCHNAPGDPELKPSIIGAGGVGPNLRVALNRLSREDLFKTIHEGRLNVNRPSMPAWAPLGKPAIDALVEFIESIQRSA